MSKILWIIAGLLVITMIFIGVYRSQVKTAYAPQEEQIGKNIKTEASSTSAIPLSVQTIKENATNTPNISVQYPQFPTLPADFNTEISSAVTDRLADFKKESADNFEARRATGDPKANISQSDYSFIASWEQAQVNQEYISFIIRFDSYTGGANENQEIQTFNYDVSAKKDMRLGDIFPGRANILETISTLARKQLTAQLAVAAPGYEPADQLNPGTEPTEENFSNFTFTDDEVTFYFPKYQVAPGAFGEQKVVLERNEVK